MRERDMFGASATKPDKPFPPLGFDSKWSSI